MIGEPPPFSIMTDWGYILATNIGGSPFTIGDPPPGTPWVPPYNPYPTGIPGGVLSPPTSPLTAPAPVPVGWVCPKCQIGVAPSESVCPRCVAANTTRTSI
jgi:hypothetical protein